MKLRFLTTTMALILPLLAAQGVGAEIINGIAAKVGGDIVTIYEFNKAYEQARFTAELMGDPTPEKREILDELINNRLLENEARRRGIFITDKELDEVIQSVKKEHNLTDQEFQQKLEQENLTVQDLKESYRMEMLKTRFINQLGAASYQGVSPEEIEAFYQNPDNRRLFTVPAQVELSQIFIPVPPEVSYQEAVVLKEKARSLHRQLQEGASFAQLAREHSQAPNNTEGGRLGSFTREQLQMFMRPEDIETLFALEPGEVAPPIRLADGYYLFKLTARQEQKLLGLEEARDRIRSYLLRRKGQERFRDWLQEARASASIQIVMSME
ncbi:MAG: peptidylprolyl isomerase [Spirochaetota bacterium]